MRIIACEQGTCEWEQARLGLPTASAFDRILTSTGKPSTQAEAYACHILAEWATGQPQGWSGNAWTDRGKELEPEARELYTLLTGNEVQQVGFCVRDDPRCGASPDGLVGEDGGLELKSPAASTHVRYLLSGKIPTDYVIQVQGALFVTGREWWDFMSHFPGLPPLLIRAEPIPALQSALAEELTKFNTMLERKRELLKEHL